MTAETPKPNQDKSVGCLVVLLVAAVILALVMRSWSMNNVQSVLEVQRTPMAYVAGLIDGLCLVEGGIEQGDATLATVIDKHPCVYYYWKLEREEEDDEGDTHWVTVETRSDSVGFDLVDPTGKVFIDNKRATERHARQTGSRSYGDYRETEYAILQSDTVTVAGYYSGENEHAIGDYTSRGMAMGFHVSSQGEAAIIRSMGWASIIYMAIALAAVLGVIFCVISFLKQYHIMGITLVATAILPPVLFLQWLTLTSDQLSSGANRAEEYKRHVYRTPEQPLESDQVLLRRALLKRDANTSIALYEVYRTRYTNMLHVLVGGYEALETVEISEREQAALGALPRRARVGAVLPVWQVVLASIAGIAGSVYALRKTYILLKSKRLIENIPTTPIKAVVPGLTEVTGTIKKKDELLTARYSGQSVVYCKYVKRKKVQTKDGAKWRVVDSGVSSTEFLLEDESGEIAMNVRKATMTVSATYSRTEGNISYTEHCLKPGNRLFVLGPAVLGSITDSNLTLKYSTKEKFFIVSQQGESEVHMKFAVSGLFGLVGSLWACTVSMIVIYGGASFDAFGFFAAAIGAITLLIVLNLGFMFNDMIFMKTWLQRAQANLNVSLKRRADLIPNLVKVVMEALSFEKDIQTRLASLRDGLHGQIDNAEEVGELYHRFSAILEDHPTLVTNDLVINLHNRILSVENQLEYARSGFNAVTRTHNTRIRKFPDSIIASMMKMKTGKYFQLESEAEGKAVDVSKMLLTAEDKQNLEQRRENEKQIKALFPENDGLVATAFYCLVAVNGVISDSEHKVWTKLVRDFSGIDEQKALDDLAANIQARINKEGLEQVADSVCKSLPLLSGTSEAELFTQGLNELAQADQDHPSGDDFATTLHEHDLVLKFRNALSAVEAIPVESKKRRRLLPRAPVAEDHTQQQELLMLTLVSLMSADGQIEPPEYEAMVDFVMSNTSLTDRDAIRDVAQSALSRLKANGLEATVDEVKVKLTEGSLSSDVVEQLIQFIEILLMADGEVEKNERVIADAYLQALKAK